MKKAGKLNFPPAQAEFDKVPLPSYCGRYCGVYYRLHGLNPKTGGPWNPVHFSRSGDLRNLKLDEFPLRVGVANPAGAQTCLFLLQSDGVLGV